MCLLVHQPKGVSFDQTFLAEVYSQNRDGLGVMYAEAGVLHVVKSLPKSAIEFGDFYRAHAEGRECVWHARMMTHGDVDLDNCHPYRVTDRVYLAHNGVLATGNEWDVSRSDTWHFIRNVIEPAVLHDERIVLDPRWQLFIGELIGKSNKFGIVLASGEVVTINRSSGVEFRGAWLSNTYAWPSARYGFGGAATSYRASTIWADTYDWDVGYSASGYQALPARGGKSRSVFSSVGESLPSITRAARNCYVRGTLVQWVKDAPAKAAILVDEIENDHSGESGSMAFSDPGFAVEIIADWFDREGL